MRPRIGLTTYGEQAQWGTNDRFVALLPMSYARSVHAAGGRALLITEDDPGADALDGLDALIVTGGPDVAPARYGEEPHEKTVTRPARDENEFTLLRAALAIDLPVLAVCRGMQLLAVHYGGRLHQHLPDVLGHDDHRPSGPGGYGSHGATFAPGSKIAGILGESAVVNSWHHQGVADVGRLTATGWSDDGLVEVVEDASKPFVVGVQWHPEELDDKALFHALVSAAVMRDTLSPR